MNDDTRKQVIFNVHDSGYYLTKLIICSLMSRKNIDNTISILINTSDILEKRLDIPNLNYTNGQLNTDSRVFIQFPFNNEIHITGEGVFNISKGREFRKYMEQICEYTDSEVDLSENSYFKQFLLTIEYLNDMTIKIDSGDIYIEDVDFFTDTDLVNLILLTSLPTLELFNVIKKDYSEDKENILKVIQNTIIDESDINWNTLGKALFLDTEINIEDDKELNSKLFRKISGSTYSENLITTTHLINLLTYQVITGEKLKVKIPENNSSKFKI